MKDALAAALVHFVWQGAALALGGWILMRLAKVPSVRYAIGVATMMAMLAAPVLTFLAVRSADGVVPVTAASSEFAAETIGLMRAGGDVAEQDVPPNSAVRGLIVPPTWIVSFWALGVCVLSLRFAGGLAMAYRVATGAVVPVSDDLQRLATRLASRLKVRGKVRVCESASVAVPIMVGWLRPVVVLPPAALANLPLAQLEALLAHEFAHIRRHDYFVNLLQTAVETICFYHPAVWWISHQVRLEREQCCDDVAVSVCDRLTYVTALSTVASLSTPRLALAATGGSLRDRVRRLVEPNTHSVSAKGGWMPILPILLVVSLVAPQAWGPESPEQISRSTPVVVEQAKPPVPVIKLERPVAVKVTPLAEEVTSEVQVTPLRVKVAPATITVARKVSEATPLKVVPILQQGPRTATVGLGQVSVQERTAAEKAAQVAKERQELKQARELERVEAEAEMAALERRLRQEAEAVARQKDLVDRGLATERTLAEVEERVAATRQRIEEAMKRRALAEEQMLAEVEERNLAVEQRLGLARRNRALSRERAGEVVEQRVAVSRQQAELERQRVLLEDVKKVEARVAETRQRAELAARQRGLSAEASRLEADLERRVASGLAVREGALSTQDPDSPVQPQDRLTIVIASEPDLPTRFTVRADGSIRFPFLGVIRVQGSTAGQIQSVIRKLIVDRGLAQNPDVTVSVGRILRRVR